MLRRKKLEFAGPYGVEVASARQLAAQTQAGQELRRDFVRLYISEQISSRDICDMAHRHTVSGGCGLEDIALVPDPKIQNHNAHLKLVLGNELGNADLTYVEAPMFDKRVCGRTKVMVPIIRPSEALSEYFLGHANACAADLLREPLEGVPPVDFDALPPAQRDHIVVKRALAAGVHPTRIRRLGIFMDAAGFIKNESFEDLFINDLDTGQRWLVAVVRKQEMCQCGCRGFCTYWPIHDALLNDLQSAADGRWSVVTHMQEPLPGGDRRHVIVLVSPWCLLRQRYGQRYSTLVPWVSTSCRMRLTDAESAMTQRSTCQRSTTSVLTVAQQRSSISGIIDNS